MRHYDKARPLSHTGQKCRQKVMEADHVDLLQSDTQHTMVGTSYSSSYVVEEPPEHNISAASRLTEYFTVTRYCASR